MEREKRIKKHGQKKISQHGQNMVIRVQNTGQNPLAKY